MGLVFAIVGLTLIGALAANLLGRSLISAGELMLGRMPIVRNVYQGLKQIFESVVTASAPSQGFQKVALMEFPSKGIWSLVFVTGDAAEQIAAEIPGEDLISVFMPTGMLPPSGFVCFVPRATVMPVQHERGGRGQDHHLGRHGEPRDAGPAQGARQGTRNGTSKPAAARGGAVGALAVSIACYALPACELPISRHAAVVRPRRIDILQRPQP